MIDHRNVRHLRSLAACTLIALTGCGRADPQVTATSPAAAEPAAAELAAAACTGARGELAELASVTGGMRPFADASLRTQYLEQLAVDAPAPAAVKSDLVQWQAHVDARQQALRNIPPRFDGGRLLEPDTAPLDRQFVTSMQPVGERLGAWVAGTCAPQARADDSAALLNSAEFPG